MENETQTQTQPQAKQLMTDIFGDSDDDNNEAPVKGSAVANMNFDDSDDDIFGGSDDEKGPTTKRKSAPKPAAAPDNLLDSDEEDAQPRKGFIRKKRPKGPAPAKTGGKLKKRKLAETKRGNDSDGASGDEYDSGEEVQATKEDRDFIAGDDDFADIVKEYDEDNIDFDDERPDGPTKKGKKKAVVVSGNHLSSGINLKDQDPLSQTLAAMKQPKAKGLTDAEKDILVEKLQKQMVRAVQLDNELFAKQQPAIHKMALLKNVQTALSMKPLHQTLLDKDILCSLRDWIEPRDANTLPALSVRTAVYEALLQLPCLPDHLKRTNNEKPPIGVIIVSLRKHKMETPENKRLLKELMDKWSRPIFSKSADVRVGGVASAVPPIGDHPEVQEAILQKYLKEAQAGRAQSQDGAGAGRGASASGSRGNVGFGAVLSKTGAGASQAQDESQTQGEDGAGGPKKAADLYNRARTPYNTGFLFTVQPEQKSVDKRNVLERSLGEGRMKLMKKAMEGSGGKGLGRKSNPRAMDMTVSSGPKQ